MSETNGKVLLASQLYATYFTSPSYGDQQCHWCGGPCNIAILHDDPPPIPFVRGSKNRFQAKCLNSLYVCKGCWYYRRPRMTVRFLDGELKDGKSTMEYSWLLKKDGAYAIRKEGFEKLWEFLVKPEEIWCLAFLQGGEKLNHIQQFVVNHIKNLKADTPIQFTVNGIPHIYTIYELEESRKVGSEGMQAGTRFLFDLLQKVIPALPLEEPKEKGRPTTKDGHNHPAHRPIPIIPSKPKRG